MKVLVAMSGGVDSSVAAARLVELGHAVTGVTLRLWGGESRRWLWPPVCWPILAFAVYAVVRYFLADIEYVARWELLRMTLRLTTAV